MDGLLLVDKPSGPTSHDVVARVRRALREKRIGHTGTLDPMATGLLPLVLGRATRLAQFLTLSDKSYDAVVRLGFATDTADAQGQTVGPVHHGPFPSRGAIEAALDAFRGTFEQQPPAFSAKKIDGQRSYKLARNARLKPRAAEEAAAPVPPALPALPAPPAVPALPARPAPVSVTVHRLDIVSVESDQVTLRVDCSAGFYVRSLAHDLGVRLGTGAHLSALRRTRSGAFTLAGAIELAIAERDPERAAAAILPMSAMLPGLAPVVLTAGGVLHAQQGRELGPQDGVAPRTGAADRVRLLDEAGELVGIGEPSSTPGLLHPSVILM
jgi:tRNA pseudouridine55 synthase